MTKKIYNFDVPVSGRETFSVVASSSEEALEKMQKEEYEVSPELQEIEWDFGLGRSADEYLPGSYTLQDFKEQSND